MTKKKRVTPSHRACKQLRRVLLLCDFLGDFGAATIDDIAPHFDVSERTIRRDLDLLVMAGRIAVVYSDSRTKWRRVVKPPTFL